MFSLRNLGVKIIDLEPQRLWERGRDQTYLLSMLQTTGSHNAAGTMNWDRYWIRINWAGEPIPETPTLFRRIVLKFSEELAATYEEIFDPSASLRNVAWAEWSYPTVQGFGPVGMLRINSASPPDEILRNRFIEHVAPDDWVLARARSLSDRRIRLAQTRPQNQGIGVLDPNPTTTTNRSNRGGDGNNNYSGGWVNGPRPSPYQNNNRNRGGYQNRGNYGGSGGRNRNNYYQDDESGDFNSSRYRAPRNRSRSPTRDPLSPPRIPYHGDSILGAPPGDRSTPYAKLDSNSRSNYY